MEAGYCPCRGRRGVPRRDVRSRARARPRSGRRRDREVRPGASMEKKARNFLSVTGGPLARRARLCEARAGGVSNERLGCSRRRFLVLLQCRAKPAARRVKCGPRSRNSPRLTFALTPGVTTRKVDPRRARAFWVERCTETPNVSLSSRRAYPKIGDDIPYAHSVTRARKDAKRTRVDRCAFR